LKKRFTKELVLAALDLDKKNKDGSRYMNYATEEVLSMECKDGK